MNASTEIQRLLNKVQQLADEQQEYTIGPAAMQKIEQVAELLDTNIDAAIIFLCLKFEKEHLKNNNDRNTAKE